MTYDTPHKKGRKSESTRAKGQIDRLHGTRKRAEDSADEACELNKKCGKKMEDIENFWRKMRF